MYLIQPKDDDPFITKWFVPENHFVKGMVVYDLHKYKFTTDGQNWNNIPVDHL